MTYRVSMIVRNRPGFEPADGPTRIVTTQVAGCVDEPDAKSKARALYDVVTFRKVETVDAAG